MATKARFHWRDYYRAVYGYHDEILDAAVPISGGGDFENDLSSDARETNVVTALGWEVYPRGLLAILRDLNGAYSLPILITENGTSEPADCNRAEYLVAHLRQLEMALAEGIPVTGYLHWSFIDNWEWDNNFEPPARFGLLSIDWSSTDADGQLLLTRQITRAALAFRYIVSSRRVAELEERFGSISPLGDTMLYSSRTNGGLWIGTSSDGRNITLWLSAFDSGRQVTGLLCFCDQAQWLAIGGTRSSGTFFRLQMPDGEGGSSTVVLDLAATSLQWPMGELQVNLTRSVLHGAWFTKSATSDLGCINLTNLEGMQTASSGKLSLAAGNRKWVTSSAPAVDNGVVTANSADLAFSATFDDVGDLTGTLTAVASGLAAQWAGTLLRDNLRGGS